LDLPSLFGLAADFHCAGAKRTKFGTFFIFFFMYFVAFVVKSFLPGFASWRLCERCFRVWFAAMPRWVPRGEEFRIFFS
jgi:hypothetical protein